MKALKKISVICMLSIALFFFMTGEAVAISKQDVAKTGEVVAHLGINFMENTMDIDTQKETKEEKEEAFIWYFLERCTDLGISTMKDVDAKSIFGMGQGALQKKYDNYKSVYKALSKSGDMITMVLEGDYDEAAIRALYVAAEVSKHPVAKLVCAAAAYTLETQKEVWDLQAATDVEVIYQKVSRDAKLFKTANLNADQPPLIPETKEMAEYFTGKYVFTDEDTRQYVKSYIKTVLDDDWPEQTWSDWAYSWFAIGSGVDTRKADDAAALENEYDYIRDCILKLIKDVNKQAQLAWAQTRLRQGQSEFNEYLKNVALIDGDFQRVLAEYKSREKLALEVPEWKKWLAESPGELAKARKLLEDPKMIRKAQAISKEGNRRMMRSVSGAHVVGEMALWKDLKVQRQAWWDFEDELERTIESNQGKVVADPGVVYVTEFEVEDAADAKDFYAQHFKPLIEPFYDWNPTEDDTKGDLMYYLNEGKFSEARGIVAEWSGQEGIRNYYIGGGKLMTPLKETQDKLDKSYDDRIAELKKEEKMLVKEYYDIRKRYLKALSDNKAPEEIGPRTPPDQAARHKQVLNAFIPQFQSNMDKKKVTKELLEKENRQKSICFEAYNMAREVVAVLHFNDKAKIEVLVADCMTMIEEFEHLRDTRRDQYNQFIGNVNEIENDLPMKEVSGKATAYSYSMDETVERAMTTMTSAIAKIESDKYAANYPFTESKDLGSLLGDMQSRADAIRNGITTENVEIRSVIQNYQAWFEGWDMAIKRWQELPEPTSREILEIKVLVGEEEAKAISDGTRQLDMAAKGVSKLKPRMEGDIEAYLRVAHSDTLARQNDADWLESKIREIRWFLDDQVKKKIIKDIGDGYSPNYVLVFKEEEGMAIAYTPYKHYMLKSDLDSYLQKVQSGWNSYPAYQYIRQSAPKVYEQLKKILVLSDVSPAPEENVIARSQDGTLVLWKSTVNDLDGVVSKLKYNDSDIKFEQAIIEISQINGMAGVITSSDTRVKYAATQSYKGYGGDYNNSLGKKYLSILDKLQDVLDKREEYLKKQAKTPTGPQVPGGGPDGPGDKPKGPAGGAPQGPGGTGGLGVRVTPGELSGFYQVYDARVNTISLRDASGDVILTNAEMRQGYIEITGRISTMQRVQKILISENDGRTWNELARNQSIRHQFVPIPNRLYQVLIKVITVDGDEIPIKVFPNINGIMYKDIDYSQLITETVRKISEAYEAKNVPLFSDYISRDFLGNKTYLMEGIRFDFDMFTDIRLVIFINRIDQGGGNFTAETKWDKTQTPRSTLQQQRTSGRTNMVFALEDGKMKIVNLRGNLIYATLSPEVAESSGLPSATVEEIRVAKITRTPVQPGAGETEESGGVSSSLQTKNGSVMNTAGNPKGFDFSSGSQVALNAGDFNYVLTNRFNALGSAQIQDVTGTSTFDSLDIAPLSGYAVFAANMVAGDVFVFITQEGYYGKMEVTSITVVPAVSATIVFRYAVQTDGSKNISTQ